MNDDNRKQQFRLRRETKGATALAISTRLGGYGCAAGAVACFFASNFSLAIVLIFAGCLIIASGAAGAELMDQKTRKARHTAQREAADAQKQSRDAR